MTDARALATILMVAMELNAGKASKEQGQNLGQKEHGGSANKAGNTHSHAHSTIDPIEAA